MAEPELALIVGASRSGTTLLRLILDAHPEIGCPAEAGLPSLMAHMATVWSIIDSDLRQGAVAADPGERAGAVAGYDGLVAADHRPVVTGVPVGIELPAEARTWIRVTAVGAMRRYCERAGKHLYVDKSLDSVHHLALVRQLFPHARQILVFRHVMDTIASGIEASPWGFHAYGYAPYVQSSPGNTVAALATYWLEHVDRALRWEEQAPQACRRVRYEDLVLQPEETVGGILQFLDVEEDLSVLHRAFDRDPPRGPGDYKVVHTSDVHPLSIGRGKRVPVGMLPPALLTALNEKLEELAYEPVGGSWNAVERQADGRQGFWSDRLSELMARVRLPTAGPEVGSFALVADDHRRLRWVVEPAVGILEQRDGDVHAVLTGTAEDLVLMLTGEENLGVLLRSGRVRHLVADDTEASDGNGLSQLNCLIALLQEGLSRRVPE